jgi:hypothetical protein
MSDLISYIALALFLLLVLSALPVPEWFPNYVNPWLFLKRLRDRIQSLSIPLLVLAIAWFLFRNGQIREILAVTYQPSGDIRTPLVATATLLLLASALWFWSNVLCQIHRGRFSEDQIGQKCPTLIPSLLLSFVVFNWCVAGLGISELGSGFRALIFGLIAWVIWFQGDRFFWRMRTLASGQYHEFAKHYFSAMGEYAMRCVSFGSWSFGLLTTPVAFLGLLLLILLLPGLLVVLALGPVGTFCEFILYWILKVAGVADQFARFSGSGQPQSDPLLLRAIAGLERWIGTWYRRAERVEAESVQALNPIQKTLNPIPPRPILPKWTPSTLSTELGRGGVQPATDLANSDLSPPLLKNVAPNLPTARHNEDWAWPSGRPHWEAWRAWEACMPHGHFFPCGGPSFKASRCGFICISLPV